MIPMTDREAIQQFIHAILEGKSVGVPCPTEAVAYETALNFRKAFPPEALAPDRRRCEIRFENGARVVFATKQRQAADCDLHATLPLAVSAIAWLAAAAINEKEAGDGSR